VSVSVDPAPIVIGVAGVGYLIADDRVRRRRGHAPRPRARPAFLAGIGVLAVALVGPLDARVTTSFTAHMVQHLLLTMIAAPLLLVGAPVTLALAAWPGAPRRSMLRVLHSGPVRVLSNPMVAWAAFFAVLWGVHLTGWYQAALTDPAVHAAEHAVLLVTALLFWMPIVRVDPVPSRLSHPGRILYLFCAMPAMAFLGLAIASARDVLYPAYAQAEGVAAALADQQRAGAIMWVGTMFLIVPALAFVLLDWMRADEREAARIDARLPAASEGGS
jgi:putative copper resistance protein D